MKSKSIKVGDMKVGYKEFGKGDPLVMIMGYGSTMNFWEQSLIVDLAKNFRVIIFDNRGINATSVGTKELTLDQFASDTAGLLDALNIKKANILGWSMGSLIAQIIAIKNPEKVEKLILCSSYCDIRMFPAAADVYRQLTEMSCSLEEHSDHLINLLFPANWLKSNQKRIEEIFYRPTGDVDPEVVQQQAKAIEKWKGSCSLLPLMDKPTLVLTGDKDVIVPQENSVYIAKIIKNSKLIKNKNAGHGFIFQCRDKFVSNVIDFLT